MMSNIPINLEKVKKEDLDKEILRVGMIAELDAVNLYEQLAAFSQNSLLKKFFLQPYFSKKNQERRRSPRALV